MPEPIIAFYLGERGAGQSDRTIEKIWQWDWERLENVHDYIQWLFPLTEGSAYNPDAPVLDEHIIERFRSTDLLKSRLKRSFEVMLNFFGLQLVELVDGRIRVDLPAEQLGVELPCPLRVRADDLEERYWLAHCRDAPSLVMFVLANVSED